jgi:galactosamine-6-phosphate isomerase
MKITYCNDYQNMSQKAAQIVLDEVSTKPDLLFCAATGNSPTGMYAGMAENKELFRKMKVIKMDEWGIIPLSHPDSCESYLQKHLLDPLEIPESHYTGFDTKAQIVDQEIGRMHNFISQNGPFDICILGLGKNGHIAFNEPDEYLEPEFHKAKLAASTIQHDPALSQGSEPAYGLCVGMRDILLSKKIIFLVTGKGKQTAIDQIMTKKITTECPASFLWMHPNVECLIDNSSLEK